MRSSGEEQLDKVGWQLLRVLQEDARLSFSELGRRVGLSSPAIAERVRRMEDLGIITGYRAMVNPDKLGYAITVFINIRTSAENHNEIATFAHSLTEVLECHHVTGQDSYILKVIVSSMAHLEHVISRLRHYGETTTSIVLSTPLTDKMIVAGPGARGEPAVSPIFLVENE